MFEEGEILETRCIDVLLCLPWSVKQHPEFRSQAQGYKREYG